MSFTLPEIALESQAEGLSPTQLSEMRLWLAGHYAYLTDKLSQILMQKPAIWNELRKGVKSDTACERIWQQTKDGLLETSLRLKLKSIEKLMSGIKTRIEVMIGESKSLY